MTPVEVTPELLRQMRLPLPDDDSDKDGRGRVLVVGGERELPGAVLLAGVAALRAGAGKLKLASPATIAPLLGVAVPEALSASLPEDGEGRIAPAAAERLGSLAEGADAVLIGPGMMPSRQTARTVAQLLPCIGPRAAAVLDAGALDCVRERGDLVRALGGRAVLTPHPGEMARMLGATQDDIAETAAEAAQSAARDLQAVIALKGACTYIATPDGDLYVHDQGCVGLATSGSGDTLGGILAGLLARGAPPLDAALWAVYLHGAAGRAIEQRRGLLGLLARELLDEIPQIMNALSRD